MSILLILAGDDRTNPGPNEQKSTISVIEGVGGGGGVPLPEKN